MACSPWKILRKLLLFDGKVVRYDGRIGASRLLLGTHHLISGGGGGFKKIVFRHKSEKKCVENVGRKKICCRN